MKQTEKRVLLVNGAFYFEGTEAQVLDKAKAIRKMRQQVYNAAYEKAHARAAVTYRSKTLMHRCAHETALAAMQQNPLKIEFIKI